MYVLATPKSLLYRFGDFRIYFSLKMWQLWCIFAPKIRSFIPFALDFFGVVVVPDFAKKEKNTQFCDVEKLGSIPPKKIKINKLVKFKIEKNKSKNFTIIFVGKTTIINLNLRTFLSLATD